MPKPYQHAMAQMPYHVVHKTGWSLDGKYLDPNKDAFEVRDFQDHLVCSCEKERTANVICKLLNTYI
jgi:hypothetical protein